MMTPSILVLPGGLPASLRFLENCQRLGVACVGASSLPVDPAAGHYPAWAFIPSVTDTRFAAVLRDVMERVLFLPWMSERDDFMSAVAAADVIIDPFHFGIDSTSAVTSIVGTPIVTKTGEFMRGRVGTAYCKMLGIEECIVEDVDAYVRLACDIANNVRHRAALKRQISANNPSYYDNMAPIHELMGWFGRIGHVHAAQS